MIEFWLGVLPLLVPFEVTPTPVAAPPPPNNGFAYTTLLGGFFGVGLIMLLYVLINLKPKRHVPYDGPND